MNAITWLLVLAGVGLNASAQLLLKAATGATGPIVLDWSGLTEATPRLLAHFGWWSGLACYAASVLIWVVALSRAPVSVIYPMLSLGYIVNAVGATLFFGESLQPIKMVGIVVIIIGVFLLSESRA